MKTIIHVNQQVIAWNRTHDLTLPVITVKQGNKNRYCDSVVIDGPSMVVNSPKKPLKCGARVWIETDSHVILENETTWKELQDAKSGTNTDIIDRLRNDERPTLEGKSGDK